MIETERLILRTFVLDDAEDVFEYLRESLVNCFADMRLDSLDAARSLVERRSRDPEYCLAIVLKDGGKVIGEIGAHPDPCEHGEGNGASDTFSPCWMLTKRYHGKGYAYEAAHAFFDYLFIQKGARRIYAYTEVDNLSSQRLCRRLGMRQEGLFNEFISFVNDENGNPVYEDTMEWAILKREWIGDRPS
ncbi:MAG: GNAT family N-acetyltransferase [Candidatus Methanomethylophilaceae archaeon]|nr:GNAT family N-acetyltransferase [Candidatus Methanomethylophilaceae archaeon]